ncbi:MAG: hypothetical protein C4324_05270 [Blastocatellia bacterium]
MAYCINCGELNPEYGRYCKKCGKETIGPGSKQGDVGERGDFRHIFSITPTIKFVIAGYVLAVIAAFAVVVALSVFAPGPAPVIGAALGVLILLIPAYCHLQTKLVRYTLTDSILQIDRGLFARTTQNIPLRRIQDVTVSASFWQRMFGYGDITIDNASEDGGKITLKKIDSPSKYAEMLLRQMRQIDRDAV